MTICIQNNEEGLITDYWNTYTPAAVCRPIREQRVCSLVDFRPCDDFSDSVTILTNTATAAEKGYSQAENDL